mgnify:FL=1
MNWINGYYSLFQKVKVYDSLKVYYPNGWFNIDKSGIASSNISSEIKIYCKSSFKVIETAKNLNELYKHLSNLK